MRVEKTPFLLFWFFINLLAPDSRAQSWVPIGPVQGIPNYGWEILEAPNGDLFVATTLGELHKFNGSTWQKTHDQVDELQDLNGALPDFEIDQQGRIYMAYGQSTATGIFIKVLIPSATGAGWDLKFSITSISAPTLDLGPDRDGNMYLAATNKLYKVSGFLLDSTEVPFGFRPALPENSFAFSPSNQMHILIQDFFNSSSLVLKRNSQAGWDSVVSRPTSFYTFSQILIPVEGKIIWYMDKMLSFNPVTVSPRISTWENGIWSEPTDTLAIPMNDHLNNLALDSSGNPLINTLYDGIFLFKQGEITALAPYLVSTNPFTYSPDIHYSFFRQKLIQIWMRYNFVVGFTTIVETSLGFLSVQRNQTVAAPATVYPNPTEGDFQIRFTGGGLTRKATLVDLMGKVHWEGEVTSGVRVSFIDGPLPAGIYYLHLNDYTKTESVKIVKQ